MVEESQPIEFEQLILSIKECFVYKVPPLRTASGHRAEEWGLDKPLFTGHLKIFQADMKLRIVLYRYKDESTLLSSDENLIQFAECPIAVNPKEDITPFVDSVIDSSRYFVLRVKDRNSTRSALIGIGFRERDSAFDFKNSLNEYVRYVDRMNAAETLSKEVHEEPAEDTTNSIPHRDLSIKEGAKIHVNVKLPSKLKSNESKSSSSSSSGGLRPPPPAGSFLSKSNTNTNSNNITSLINETSSLTLDSQQQEQVQAQDVDDSDWGDFTSST